MRDLIGKLLWYSCSRGIFINIKGRCDMNLL